LCVAVGYVCSTFVTLVCRCGLFVDFVGLRLIRSCLRLRYTRYLWLVWFIWLLVAFAFGSQLLGDLLPWFVGLLRLVISVVVVVGFALFVRFVVLLRCFVGFVALLPLVVYGLRCSFCSLRFGLRIYLVVVPFGYGLFTFGLRYRCVVVAFIYVWLPVLRLVAFTIHHYVRVRFPVVTLVRCVSAFSYR